ncbi:MAG: hypothetical protein DSY92_10560, partial [Planctomycetota bacterium]
MTWPCGSRNNLSKNNPKKPPMNLPASKMSQKPPSLQLNGSRALEQFLSRYQGACLFVTHDRYFLDRISNRIVEIRRGKCDSYQGNYTDFLLSRAERDLAEARNEHKRQRFLKRELEWVRRGPKARTTKAKDRMDRYFEIADQEAPEEELDVDLIIP